MNLADLKTSISSMSDEDLLSLLKDVRADRRVKVRSDAKGKKTGGKKEQGIDLAALLANPELSSKLLEALMEAKKDGT